MSHHQKKISHKQAYAYAVQSLKHAKLKVTKPRMAILDILIRHHEPFTLDEIHKEVARHEVDRVTVYRCLDSFHESGIVRRCDFGDGPVRFEYQGVGAEHHHHIVCRKCRKIKDLKECLVENIEDFLEKAGYSNITHSLEFFGICSKCLHS
jgi:Fur family transcriptional regulator, ferric uptake regulator